MVYISSLKSQGLKGKKKAANETPKNKRKITQVEDFEKKNF